MSTMLKTRPKRALLSLPAVLSAALAAAAVCGCAANRPGECRRGHAGGTGCSTAAGADAVSGQPRQSLIFPGEPGLASRRMARAAQGYGRAEWPSPSVGRSYVTVSERISYQQHNYNNAYLRGDLSPRYWRHWRSVERRSRVEIR